MTREDLYKKYLGLIVEPATKYYEYFVGIIEEIIKDKKFRKTSDVEVKFNEEIAKNLIIECLIYSIAMTERLSYQKIDEEMRKEAINECFEQLFPDIVEYNHKKTKIDRIKFENFCWERYQEYGTLLTNSKEDYQLIFIPIGAKKEDLQDPIYRTTARFIGIISFLMRGNYNDIPGIERGPYYINGLIFNTLLTNIFIDFLKRIITDVLMPAIATSIFEKKMD